MARDPQIDARLMRWADAVTVGDGSGYPSVCVLDPDWSPPSPGQTPTMKVSMGGHDVRATHRAISLLSMRQRNTVVVHYVIKGSVASQAEQLECAPDTVHQRVEQVHAALARILAEEFCNNQQAGQNPAT